MLNGLVAKARGAKEVTIMDVSRDRLDLLAKLGLPFDDLVNSAETDPEEWVKEHTGGRGVDAVVVAASVKALVPVGVRMLAISGHISIFAGMPKSDPVELIDLNLIHYKELNVHGANSSSKAEYLSALELMESGKVKGAPLVTHTFGLDDFNKAFQTQSDPSTGALKVVIKP